MKEEAMDFKEWRGMYGKVWRKEGKGEMMKSYYNLKTFLRYKNDIKMK